MNLRSFFEEIVEIYTNCFWGTFAIFVVALAIVGISLFFKMKNEEDKRWYKFIYVIKKKLIEILTLVFMLFVLGYFLYETFSIDLFANISKYWKIAFTIWLIYNFFSGKKLYNKLNFKEFLRNVINGEYHYTSSENILLSEIENYNLNYELQTERLGILKSLTPISLVPLIAGYILEGKSITVNWNWYTVAFLVVLFIYFYNVWKCYSNMKFWKQRAWEVQEEIRNMQFKKENAEEWII